MSCPGCNTGGIMPHVGDCQFRPPGTDYSGLVTERLALAGIYDPQTDRLASIDLNARAYGWQVGRMGLTLGQVLPDKIAAEADNPFLDPDWRDNL